MPTRVDRFGYFDRLYETLEVRRDANEAQLKKAFMLVTRRTHPDKNVGQSEEVKKKNTELFNAATYAYQILKDPERRAAYDSQGYYGVEQLERYRIRSGGHQVSPNAQ